MNHASLRIDWKFDRRAARRKFLANGRSQTEGDQLIRMYWELGLKLGSAELAIEPGVGKIWERMSTGTNRAAAVLDPSEEWGFIGLLTAEWPEMFGPPSEIFPPRR